jgi:hypothetical protein
MPKNHKDLPGGSQAWAAEVDALMEENRHLKEVVKRLCENAGLDYSNPKRNINAGAAPSVQNPVGQKLSSLADVQTYNVADKQVLTWSQMDQRWLPATPASGGNIPIPVAYTFGPDMTGQGYIDEATQTWAYMGQTSEGDAEMWGTDVAFIGSGNWDSGPLALIEVSHDGFGRPYISLSAEDYNDNTYGYMTLYSYGVRFNCSRIILPRCTTATRPADLGSSTNDLASMVYDDDLGIPILWNGTAWVNLIGTAV